MEAGGTTRTPEFGAPKLHTQPPNPRSHHQKLMMKSREAPAVQWGVQQMAKAGFEVFIRTYTQHTHPPNADQTSERGTQIY